MKIRFVHASVAAVAILLGACGSDAVDSSATSSTQGAAAGESNGTDAAPGETNGAVTRLWVKPDLVDCVGEMEQKCMQVAEAEDGEYLYFYDEIAGFEFVEGVSFVIDVRVEEVADPPADGSSLSYTLVEIVEQSSSED